MQSQIPSDFQPFVDRMIAARRFLHEEDVLVEGLRLLQAKEVLREEIQIGFSQLDQGLAADAKTVLARLKGRIDALEMPE